jgi:hypothetical protein
VFTDNPVTPTRVEALVDLLRSSRRKFTRGMLYRLFQPDELPALRAEAKDKYSQTKSTLKAAGELRLIELGEDPESPVNLLADCPSSKTTRTIVLEALDRHVLATVDIEPYFAPFYSYILYLGERGIVNRSGDEWSIAFERDVHGGERPSNPFNSSKWVGLHRWYAFSGLGWYDPKGTFQPIPSERLARQLPAIFGKERRLASDDFMRRMAEHCPELDGGEIFTETNRNYQPRDRICSLGLSHALIELHEDGVLRLECPRDARGWNIAAAQPASDGKFLMSERIDYVSLLEGAR